MDALARIEPVARPLLREVDDVLSTLGAPVRHPVWSLLRRVGATPADAVAHFAELAGTAEGVSTPDQTTGALRDAAGALREQADGYAATAIPAATAWEGGASDAYRVRAAALDGHLRGGDGMAGRLIATASYVDEIAGWQQRSRDLLARTLAGVLTSAQAVTLRAGSPGPVAPAAVGAAADIGAAILIAVDGALEAANDLGPRWEQRLAELPYRAPVEVGPTPFDVTIHLRH